MDWNIQSRGHACHACQAAFADKQVYHTLLSEDRAGYVRQDVCAACWDSQHRQESGFRKGFVSHWQGIYEAPVREPDPIRKETAETLLRRLVELGDPSHAAACFILAVMLERKRLLKVKGQAVRDGAKVYFYEHPKTGDAFTIVDPELQLNQLDEVQRDVARLLEHGLPTVEGSAPGVEAPPEAGPEGSGGSESTQPVTV